MLGAAARGDVSRHVSVPVAAGHGPEGLDTAAGDRQGACRAVSAPVLKGKEKSSINSSCGWRVVGGGQCTMWT